MTTIDLRPLHQLSLDLAAPIIEKISSSDLSRPTPCVGWDLAALLGHMIGQNHGFAHAVESAEDAPLDAFVAQPPGDDLAGEWHASTEHIAAAFAAADLTRPILLPEISLEHRLPVAMVVGFHLIDTVVHGWDVATALDIPFRPSGELLAASLQIAEMVPPGPAREQTGSSFAPVLALREGDTDAWRRTLTLLGRRPTPHDA